MSHPIMNRAIQGASPSKDVRGRRRQASAAAKAAREFPALLTPVASGDLHLSDVVALAPHLTRMNVDGADSRRVAEDQGGDRGARFPRTEEMGSIALVSAHEFARRA